MTKTPSYTATHEVAPGYFVEVAIADTANGPVLSITGTTPESAGQCDDAIAALPEGKLCPGWTVDLRDRLVAAWRQYHLNDMRAGCEHQQAWPLNTPIVSETVSIDWDVHRAIERNADAGNGQAAILARLLQRAGIKPFAWAPMPAGKLREELDRSFKVLPEHEVAAYLVKRRQKIDDSSSGWAGSLQRFPLSLRTETTTARWVRPSEHPAGLLTKPCEVCGYAYGSAWRYLPIPADVIAFLQALPSIGAVNPYDLQAARWLLAYDVTFTAQHAKAKARAGTTADQHWRVTLRHGLRLLAFDFWASQHDTAAGTALGAYDVLSCLASDMSYLDADEVAGDLGLKPSEARAAVAFAKRIGKFIAALPDGAREALEQIR